jgi:transposase-like protein
MRERRRKFTSEFKDEAVKMVIESSRPVAEVAREIQVNEGTLGNWVHSTGTGSTTSARNHRCRSRSEPGSASSNGKCVS